MKKHSSKQLYFRLFWGYTIILFFVAAVLELYFFTIFSRKNFEESIEIRDQICHDALDYLKETEQQADHIYMSLYRSQRELDDMIAYFRLDEEEYQKYCLEKYMATKELEYRSIYDFINEAFTTYDELKEIELVSYATMKMTRCYPEKVFFPGKDGKKRISDLETGQNWKKGELVYLKEIRNPDTLEQEGCMVFVFDGRKAFEKLNAPEDHVMLAVVSRDAQEVFADESLGEWKWKEASQQKKYDVTQDYADEYKVYAYVDKKAAAALKYPVVFAILGVGILVMTAGIFGIACYVKRFTARVEGILDAMNKVKTGNLRERIQIDRERDELDMIAGNFNEMCGKLELYIQKSYLAEIETKNAQIQALQSQINPHFLYNTLEAIRMKAICNGDREVGKMLYSMVALFRSQLKEADIITLGQELDYCKQYMELFEYRYQGCFLSEVECPVELLALPVPKFILQPVVENYFIHGIERDRKDNHLLIYAERQGEKLCIYVEDNGCGMDEEKIREKNRELREDDYGDKQKKSIGIGNVNRRIKAVYGDAYGIFIQKAEPKGLQVILTIRIEEGNGDGKDHAGGR